MLKPKNIAASRFEDGPWGGRFPENEYFPAFLGNGRDAMLINCCGSGDGSWEYTPYASGAISKLHSAGWYKADRRVKRPELGVYGPLICFLEFSARPLVDGEVLAPRATEQYFAPKRAMLTTFLSQQDNRTGERTELRIETWLHRDGILVEQVHVIAAPACGLRYGFSLNTPSYGYQNTTLPTVQPSAFAFEEASGGSIIRCHLDWPGLRAAAASIIIGASVEEVHRREIPEQKLVLTEQRTALLRAGDQVTRILSVQDNYEKGMDPEDVVAGILVKVEEQGAQSLLVEHQEEWEAYFSPIQMKVPDAAVQHLYDTSRYLLKANQHPCGFHPVGLLPFQWQGAMFWDSALFADVFLECGNENEAANIFGHVKKMIPHARQLAKSYGNCGARIEWTLNMCDFSAYHEPVRQFHNNAVWAMAIARWLASRPADDTSEEFFSLVEELLLFLCDEFWKDQKDGSGAWMVGIDESVAFPKTHDTWTIATMIASLRQYQNLCAHKGRSHNIHRLDEIVALLEGLLAGNIDEDGVLQSFRGGRLPHMGSLIYDLLPAHPAASATLDKFTENYDPGLDQFNFRGSSRSAEKCFPWASFWFCRCLARTGRKEAHEYFLNATRTCGYFGSFSERIFYHGESCISWFATAHAALVWALHGMFAHLDENVLHILPGIDLEKWPDLEISGLDVGKGLRLTLKVRGGDIDTLAIFNSSREEVHLLIRSSCFSGIACSLRHGENRIFPK